MSTKKAGKKQLNILLDLETLGIKPGCPILSIGATIFDTGEVPSTMYYSTISIVSNLELGLITEQAAYDWWQKQPPAAREEVFNLNGIEIITALNTFADYIHDSACIHSADEILLWGNSSTFDNEILRRAYELAGIRTPWNSYGDRCYRTLKNLPGVPAPREFEGTKHNALVDALNQARHAEEIFNYLRGLKQNEVPQSLISQCIADYGKPHDAAGSNDSCEKTGS